MPFVLKGTRERERESQSVPPHSPRGNLNYAPSPSSHMLTHPPTPPTEEGQEIPRCQRRPPAPPTHPSAKGDASDIIRFKKAKKEGTCVRTRTTYMHTKGEEGPGQPT